MNKEFPITVTTYRPNISSIRGVKKYDSYEEFTLALEGLCKLAGFKGSVLGWDDALGNFCIEDEYGVLLIGIIEVDAKYNSISVDEFLEQLN
jgi:hypothetical protein